MGKVIGIDLGTTNSLVYSTGRGLVLSEPSVVVYDKATGNKYFDVMNVATGRSIPNVPRRDPMFMEDTTLDIQKKIAKNINLNETFPIVIINEPAFERILK